MKRTYLLLAAAAAALPIGFGGDAEAQRTRRTQSPAAWTSQAGPQPQRMPERYTGTVPGRPGLITATTPNPDGNFGGPHASRGASGSP